MVGFKDAFGGVTCLRDSLVENARSQQLSVQRDSEGSPVPVSELETYLEAEHDLSIKDATHAKIKYEFQVMKNEFDEIIRGIGFYRMPENHTTSNAQVNTSSLVYFRENYGGSLNDYIQTLWTSPHRPKCGPGGSYEDYISFAWLVRGPDSRIIAIDGNDVRIGHDSAKIDLVDRITRLTYSTR